MTHPPEYRDALQAAASFREHLSAQGLDLPANTDQTHFEFSLNLGNIRVPAKVRALQTVLQLADAFGTEHTSEANAMRNTWTLRDGL